MSIGKSSISNLPSVFFDGMHRVLGCLPSSAESLATFPKFGDHFRGLDPSQWQEIDLEHYNLPILDQMQSSSCFPAGTPILMADGTERPIEEIGKGNKVVTHKGRAREVVDTFERNYTGNTYEIKVKGWGYPLVTTDEHPIAVLGDNNELTWKEAKNITEDDWVFFSRGIENETAKEITVSDYITDDVVLEGEYCRIKDARKSHVIPTKIELNEEFARLIGLFLAEGNYSKSCGVDADGLCFTFSSSETDLHQFVQDSMKNIFGCIVKVVNLPKRASTTRIICLNATIARFFRCFCGEYSYGKFVNPVFYRVTRDVRLALLRGWLNGDGPHSPVRMKNVHTGKQRKAIQSDGVTVSEEMHRGMFRLALSCGLKPGASTRKQAEHQNYAAKNLVFYSSDIVEIFPEAEKAIKDLGFERFGERKSYKTHDLGVICRVISVTKSKAKLKVYNFEVKEDNSYVANNIIVHNCVGHGCCSGSEMAWVQAGLPLQEFSPWFLYGLINGGRDQGASISDALTALQSNGICPKNDIPAGEMFSQQFPANAFTDATKYKVIKAFHCAAFNDICSAISLGFPTPLGIYVGNNFPQLDSEGVAPLPNGGGGGHCVMPETIISSPEMKQAKDVKVGDLVFGHDGKQHKVQEVFKRRHKGNMVKISAGGYIGVTVTEEHPVLVYRRARQDVCVSKTNGFVAECEGDSHYKAWMRYEPAWIMAKDVKIGDYIVTPKLKDSCVPEIPEWVEPGQGGIKLKTLTPSDDLAWLFGYFVGDGSTCCTEKTRNKNIELIFASHDRKLAERAMTILNDIGVNARIKKETKTYIKIRAYSSSLAKSFREWFGGHSHEKRVPSWIFNGWNLGAFLDGLMDADGCIHKGIRIFHTTSPILAQQGRLMAASLGHRPSGSIAGHSRGSFANARKAYVVKWVNGKQKMIRDTDSHILSPVKSTLLVPYEGDVYNYEVEDCHSYLADTIAVHNCILGMGLKKSARYGWVIKIQNSWGQNFGLNGHCYLQQAAFQYMAPDAFAIQSMSTSVADPNPPPVVA